jgi:hypothetical protein
MKPSLVRRSTALASVTLLTLLLAPPAHATPWDIATKSWLLAADWVETVRGWLAGRVPGTEPTKPAGTTMRKKTAPGDGGGGSKVRERGDTGVCTDPNGNPIVCAGT